MFKNYSRIDSLASETAF